MRNCRLKCRGPERNDLLAVPLDAADAECVIAHAAQQACERPECPLRMAAASRIDPPGD